VFVVMGKNLIQEDVNKTSSRLTLKSNILHLKNIEFYQKNNAKRNYICKGVQRDLLGGGGSALFVIQIINLKARL